MAVLHILDRDFDIRPYRLGEMIAAAPFIDAQKARQEAIEARAGVKLDPDDTVDDRKVKLASISAATPLADLMANIADAVRVLHVGVARIDPSVTIEMMLDDAEPTPQGMASIMTAMQAVLNRSGMVAGKAPASGAAETGEALPSTSATSSST